MRGEREVERCLPVEPCIADWRNFRLLPEQVRPFEPRVFLGTEGRLLAERSPLRRAELPRRPFGELRHRIHIAGGARLGRADFQLRFRHPVSVMHVDLALSERDLFRPSPAHAGERVNGRRRIEEYSDRSIRCRGRKRIVDLIFGTGMAAAWKDSKTEVEFGGKRLSPKSFSRIGDGKERLFFVSAHRSMLISDGWASPFQKLTSDTPAVARIFSQNLFDRFSGKDAGTLFPVEKRLKREIREQIDNAIFHGGKVGIEEDPQHARRLRLVHGGMHLPFMTWTAGQREFTPLLLGLYHLLPSVQSRKRAGTDWVVLEEPEMGLHPQAVTAVLLLVLDLLWRGYRVVLSTHSPHVLTMLWMMRRLQEHGARAQRVCEAFGVTGSPPMLNVADAALKKDYRAYLLHFDNQSKVKSLDISTLDPGAEDERIAGWGGLTEYWSRFGEAVREAVNDSG